MKTVRKRYCEWDDSIRRRLKCATLSGGYLKRFVQAEPRSLTIVAFSRKQIMGWVFILSVDGENNVNTFVNERYRGRGVGRYLIERALDIYPQVVLCQWNKVTKAFFGKLNKKHPGKVKVINWWKNVRRYQKIVETLQKQNKALQ